MMLLDHGVEISLRGKAKKIKKYTLCYGVQQGVTRQKEKSVLGTLFRLQRQKEGKEIDWGAISQGSQGNNQ